MRTQMPASQKWLWAEELQDELTMLRSFLFGCAVCLPFNWLESPGTRNGFGLGFFFKKIIEYGLVMCG